MGKIRITENELKNVVRDSVISVLNEAAINYGMDWDKLSDQEKADITNKYWWRRPSMALTSPEKQQKKAENIYKRKQARQMKNGKLSYSADQYNAMQDAQAKSADELNDLQGKVESLEAEKTRLSKVYNQKVKELRTIAQKLGVSYDATATKLNEADGYQNIGLSAILGAIDRLIQQKDQLTQANQELTTKNQQLANRVSNNANAVKKPENNLASMAGAQQISSPQIAKPQANPAPTPIQKPNKPTALPGQTPGTSLAQK